MMTLDPSAPSENHLYPRLDQMPEPRTGPDQRLGVAMGLRRELESEVEKRRALYKRYRRGVNALDGVDTALLTVAAATGVAGVGLMATVIAAPVVMGLEAGALICGLLGAAGRFVGRRLEKKAKKHDEIAVLARAKLDTIADHVSRALDDGSISQEEFRLISDEVAKYRRLKAEIRAASRKAENLDNEQKNELIQRGREAARAEILQKLAGGRAA